MIVMKFERLVPMSPSASDGTAEPRKVPLAEADTDIPSNCCSSMKLPKVFLWMPVKLDEKDRFFFNEILIDPLLMVVCEIILPNWSSTVRVSVKSGSLASSVLMVAMSALTEKFASGTNPTPCRKVTLEVVTSKPKEKIMRKVELSVLCASTFVCENVFEVETAQEALATSPLAVT